jgi:NAD+ kinase
MEPRALRRLGLVVHPRRELGHALDTVQRWSDAEGVDLVQVPTGQERRVAQPGEAGDCDLIVALGGDGTALAAIHAAAPAGTPVLGVACGSLGALTAVTADDLEDALQRVGSGDWTARRLPGVAIASEGGPELVGVNDLVLVRQGASQVIASVSVDGELFIRVAGDGVVVAAPLGSSAYTLAAGGPVLAPGAAGLVVTPLAFHGGCCPPLVAGPDSRVEIELEPGPGGARVEVDGQVLDRTEALVTRTFAVTLRPDHATLVALGGEEPLLAGLRRRKILIDSPRILARDARAALG